MKGDIFRDRYSFGTMTVCPLMVTDSHTAGFWSVVQPARRSATLQRSSERFLLRCRAVHQVFHLRQAEPVPLI